MSDQTQDEFGYADAWRPEPGDVLRGKVVDLDTGHSEFGAYPIVTVESDGNRYAVHGFHTALRNRLAKVRPVIGDRIAIRFDGDVESKNGRSKYKGYSVSSPDKKASPEFWNDHRDTQARSQADPRDDLEMDDIPF